MFEFFPQNIEDYGYALTGHSPWRCLRITTMLGKFQSVQKYQILIRKSQEPKRRYTIWDDNNALCDLPPAFTDVANIHNTMQHDWTLSDMRRSSLLLPPPGASSFESLRKRCVSICYHPTWFLSAQEWGIIPAFTI